MGLRARAESAREAWDTRGRRGVLLRVRTAGPKAPLDKELAEEYVSCILSAYSPSALLPLGSYSPSALTPPRLLLPPPAIY
jgi:hypothetical protein